MAIGEKALLEMVGARFRCRREKMRLTREQLAEETGIGPSVLGEIERGTCAIGLHTFRKLCLALNISADDALALYLTRSANAQDKLGGLRHAQTLIKDEIETIEKQARAAQAAGDRYLGL